MTKPQYFTEPSMDDILASIRKMISEERLGPRPIPDQIGRSPFGESVAEQPIADPTTLGANFEPMLAPAERAPSFSSLSDALKAATPSPEERRTLEDKIADMLEPEDETPRRPVSRTDSLAVFAATRPGPVNVPGSGPLGAPSRGGMSPTASPEQPTSRMMPAPEDDPPISQTPRPGQGASRAPLNAAHHREDRAPAEARGSRPGSAPSSPKVAGPATLAEPKLAEAKPAGPKLSEPKDTAQKKADTQRVIAMPPRPGATVLNGSGQTAAPTPSAATLNGSHGPAINGANVASLGQHAFSAGLSAKAPDGGKSVNGSGSSRGLQAKSGGDALRGKTDDRPAETPSKSAPGAEMSRRVDPAPEPVSGSKSAPVTSATARPAPSDALIDAVVAMVHKEPDTLSVFTSGSAFIHGCADDEPVRKPGPNMGRKLDRSAAELLRPMLRQWLSENMPRIVEDALRSELMSSQPEGTDSDEA